MALVQVACGLITESADDITECEEMVSFECYQDSEGDCGVIGGINTFTVVEMADRTCTCQWSKTHLSELEDKAQMKFEGFDY